jgi:hypothetical protein
MKATTLSFILACVMIAITRVESSLLRGGGTTTNMNIVDQEEGKKKSRANILRVFIHFVSK